MNAWPLIRFQAIVDPSWRSEHLTSPSPCSNPPTRWTWRQFLKPSSGVNDIKRFIFYIINPPDRYAMLLVSGKIFVCVIEVILIAGWLIVLEYQDNLVGISALAYSTTPWVTKRLRKLEYLYLTSFTQTPWNSQVLGLTGMHVLQGFVLSHCQQQSKNVL